MAEIVEILKEADINAEKYQRGPLGKRIFTMAVTTRNSNKERQPKGIIRFWPGDATIEVTTDRRFRQAVLEVVEDKRTIERNMEWRWARTFGKVFSLKRARLIAAFQQQISLPSTTGYKVINLEDRAGGGFKGTVIATVPGTHQSYLVGFDESFHFISQLPKVGIKSVEEAHEVLKPKAIKKNFLRQGEWFFVPVSNTLNETLHKMIVKRDGTPRLRGSVLEPTSTHEVSTMINYKDHRYAIGYVVDNRIGHHKPLWLPTWHRVLRNREIVQRQSAVARRWD